MKKKIIVAVGGCSIAICLALLSPFLTDESQVDALGLQDRHRDRIIQATESAAERALRLPAWAEVKASLQQPLPDRTPSLIKALEDMQTVVLDHEMLGVIRSIIDEGDLTECNAVFSMLEQREEIDSVQLVASMLQHKNDEVRHRAWMASEAMAGKTMNSEAEIVDWARSWQPEQAVAELMRATPENAPDAPQMEHPSKRKGASPAQRQWQESGAQKIPGAGD